MSEQRIPQLSVDSPAILPGDSLADIRYKLDGHLSDIREAFDKRHEKELQTGAAKLPNYVPTVTVNLAVAYQDAETADKLLEVLNTALAEFIPRLAEHDFFLVDVHEWKRVTFTNTGIPNPYDYSIGAVYPVRIADTIGRDNYNRLSGEEWVKAQEQFDAGELQAGQQDPRDGVDLGDVLRSMAAGGARRH